MADKSAEKARIQRGLTLQYYNSILMEEGLISERDYRRLALRIRTKYKLNAK